MPGVEALRRDALKAMRDEETARKAISALMTAYLGGIVRVSKSRFMSAGGLAYVAWTDQDRSKGLLVKQDRHGINIALDIGQSVEIGRGDGLSGVLDAIVLHFYRHLPKDGEAQSSGIDQP